MLPALCLLIFVGAASCAPSHLLVVGGHLDDNNADIYGKMVELSGGAGQARMAVITAASSDPANSGAFYVAEFKRFGAAEVTWIPISVDHKDVAFDPEYINVALSVDGFFFGGGDQSRIVESLFVMDDVTGARSETPLMGAIRDGHASGRAAVGGTSAGADAITGAVMITAGLSYDALVGGAHEGLPAPIGDNDLYYDPLGGMGLLPSHVIDTHFSQRGRQGRMIRLLSDTKNENLGTPFGFGVDEDTSLIVTEDRDSGSLTGEVLGTFGVNFFDVSHAEVTVDADGFWGIDGVKTSYLTEGDIVDMITGEIISFARESIAGRENYSDARTSPDVFGPDPTDDELPGEYANIAQHLTDSTETETFGVTLRSDPAVFNVFMREDGSSVGSSGFREGGEGDQAQYRVSYSGLYIDINAV